MVQSAEVGTKIVSACVLFIVTFGSTLLPYKIKNFSASEWCLKNISCFCGGLFVGLCFLHLIPDALRDFSSVTWLKNVQLSYPMAELIICVGMMVVMIAEKLATVIQEHRDEKQQQKQCSASKDCCKERCPVQGEKSPLIASFNNSYNTTTENVKSTFPMVAEEPPETLMFLQSNDKQTLITEKPNPTLTASLSASLKIGKEVRSKVIKTICLVIALMIHSMFEGLTVGLQKSTYGLIELVGVLAFHKSIIGFSLGLQIVTTDRGLKFHLKQAILFAFATPIGVITGTLLVSTKLHIFNDGAMSILTCLATGTFLYITFFEILAKNLNGNQVKDLVSFAYFLIGFGIFAGITAIPVMQT